MNKLMEAHKRKMKDFCTITSAIESVADEIHLSRKNDDEIMFQLKNIAGSLDYISQYLYDISWELKKKNDNVVDTDKVIHQYYTMTKTIDITPTWSALVPIMVEVLKNPKANNAAKQEVVVELKRLAKIVDDQNKKAKKNG